MSEKSLNFVCWREDEVTRGLPCDKKEMRQSLYNKAPEKKRLVANCLILTTCLKRNTKRRSST